MHKKLLTINLQAYLWNCGGLAQRLASCVYTRVELVWRVGSVASWTYALSGLLANISLQLGSVALLGRDQ